MQLAGSSPLWGSGCAPKSCCGFLGPRDTVDVWNVQRVLRAQSRTSWHWLHGQSTHLVVHLGSLAGRTQSSKRRGSSSAQQKCRDAKSTAPYKWWLEAVCQRQRSTCRQENLLRRESSARRWYTCWETSSAQRQYLLTGKTHPGWHHLVVRARFNVSSCAERRALSSLLTRSSFPSVQREKKTSDLFVIPAGVMLWSDGPALVMRTRGSDGGWETGGSGAPT